jgi:hypothetical protein
LNAALISSRSFALKPARRRPTTFSQTQNCVPLRLRTAADLSERGAALHHHQSSDVHELVKRRATAEKRAVIDPNVTGKQTVVSDDDIVSDLAIVTDVCAGHQKILITDFCGAASACRDEWCSIRG